MDFLEEGVSVTKSYALYREEFDNRRGKNLLQGPSPGEPSTVPESLVILGEATERNIREIYVGFFRLSIPSKHRVYCFLKLCAA